MTFGSKRAHKCCVLCGTEICSTIILKKKRLQTIRMKYCLDTASTNEVAGSRGKMASLSTLQETSYAHTCEWWVLALTLPAEFLITFKLHLSLAMSVCSNIRIHASIYWNGWLRTTFPCISYSTNNCFCLFIHINLCLFPNTYQCLYWFLNTSNLLYVFIIVQISELIWMQIRMSLLIYLYVE